MTKHIPAPPTVRRVVTKTEELRRKREGTWDPTTMVAETSPEGAALRAKFALSKLGGDLGVGVEGGIFQISHTYFDHQQAAIVDASGKLSLGHSAGYPLPTKAVETMIKAGKELERYAESLSGISEIGDKGGLVHHLTKGVMTRTDLTEQCVMMALIPWLHKDVYGF